MTSKDFVIWFKGFTEGAHGYNITPKQWDLLKEKINEVEDEYEEQLGTFEDHSISTPPYPYQPYVPPYYVGDPPGWMGPQTISSLTGSGTVSGVGVGPSGVSFTVTTASSGDTMIVNSTVWNDKMGCWHYTNYPEGFGYYINSTAEGKKEKKQLND